MAKTSSARQANAHPLLLFGGRDRELDASISDGGTRRESRALWFVRTQVQSFYALWTCKLLVYAGWAVLNVFSVRRSSTHPLEVDSHPTRGTLRLSCGYWDL